MNIKRLITNSLMAGLLAATALPAVAVAPAAAKGREVIRTGGCSGAATWKLKLKLDNGKLDTEFQVDNARVGSRWRVNIFDNGARIFGPAVRVARAPSGSFTVNVLSRNRAGADHVVGRARNLASGQVCRASATF